MQHQAQRRRFSPQEKVNIVLEGLRGDVAVSALCRRHGIASGQFYQWRDKLVCSAKDAFAQRGRRKGNGEAEKLKQDLVRKDSIIAEMAEEILKVKKGLWP